MPRIEMLSGSQRALQIYSPGNRQHIRADAPRASSEPSNTTILSGTDYVLRHARRRHHDLLQSTLLARSSHRAVTANQKRAM